MEYPVLKFLNIQYFFCIIYSLFGGKCTEVDEFGNVINDTSAELSAATTTPQNLDFWAWLFGGQPAGGAPVEPTGFAGFLVSVGSAVGDVFSVIWGFVSAISYTMSGIMILLIIGAAVGLFFIRSAESEKYKTLPPATERESHSRQRWQSLLDRAISTNPKEWRGAIIEADMMLGELLQKLGYQGDMTSDRLRSVPEGAFVTLPNAWEAHRIRNFVAAKSSDYILTQREAFRVMKLYEQVFEEFHFV